MLTSSKSLEHNDRLERRRQPLALSATAISCCIALSACATSAYAPGLVSRGNDSFHYVTKSVNDGGHFNRLLTDWFPGFESTEQNSPGLSSSRITSTDPTYGKIRYSPTGCQRSRIFHDQRLPINNAFYNRKRSSSTQILSHARQHTSLWFRDCDDEDSEERKNEHDKAAMSISQHANNRNSPRWWHSIVPRGSNLFFAPQPQMPEEQYQLDNYLKFLDRRYHRLHDDDERPKNQKTTAWNWLFDNSNTSTDGQERMQEDALHVLGVAELASKRLLQKRCHRAPAPSPSVIDTVSVSNEETAENLAISKNVNSSQFVFSLGAGASVVRRLQAGYAEFLAVQRLVAMYITSQLMKKALAIPNIAANAMVKRLNYAAAVAVSVAVVFIMKPLDSSASSKFFGASVVRRLQASYAEFLAIQKRITMRLMNRFMNKLMAIPNIAANAMVNRLNFAAAMAVSVAVALIMKPVDSSARNRFC